MTKESLSEILEKYQSLVENLSVGVYRNTPGPKGNFLEANSEMISIFEAKSKEDLFNHNVSDLYVNPKERKEFVKEIMAKGEVKNREINLITLKGRKFVGSITAVMKKDKNKKPYFDGIVTDITEKKKLERDLIKYQDTLEIQVESRTQQLQDLNKKLYSEIAERKKTYSTLQESNKELVKTKQAMLNVMEDLENAKGIIELEKAKDEAMLASIGEGMVAVDNEGKVIIMNKVAEDTLGWNIKDLIGRALTNLILEDENGSLIPLKDRPTTIALATGEITKANYFLVKEDGIRLPIAITATPIRLNDKTLGLIEIIRDITKEKEIDKAKSEFVSLASHQLRTPLGIMKWYLEALESEEYMKKSPEIIRKYFLEISKSNERVLSLVHDLLSVSRIDQGRIKNDPKQVNIIVIIKDIIEQMSIIAKKKKIELNLTILDEKIPSITIDNFRFHEVVENLIANAIEYSNPEGKVDVSVEKEKDIISIRVQDKGIGISETDQQHLFTKFYRSEDATKHNPEGSGLGLYVVKSYVEDWGGKIHVNSITGKGSTFTISLPTSQKF